MIYLETSETHVEVIKCPECETIQDAVVEHTVPFYCYVHECVNCKYIIMESEWGNVNVDNSILKP